MQVHIRWMIRRDIQEVLQIEKSNFEFPWSEEDLIDHLRQRNCIGMVTEYEDQIVGFVVYQLHKKFLGISNLAVKKDCQRMGVGTQIINKLKNKLSRQRRTQLRFLIRETNFGGQQFLAAQQFKACGIQPAPWEETDEDGYKMLFAINRTLGQEFHPENRISKLV